MKNQYTIECISTSGESLWFSTYGTSAWYAGVTAAHLAEQQGLNVYNVRVSHAADVSDKLFEIVFDHKTRR